MPARVLEDGPQAHKLLALQNNRYRFHFGHDDENVTFDHSSADSSSETGSDKKNDLKCWRYATTYIFGDVTATWVWDFLMLLVIIAALISGCVCALFYSSDPIQLWNHRLVFDDLSNGSATDASLLFDNAMKNEFCPSALAQIQTSFGIYGQRAIHVTVKADLAVNYWALLLTAVVLPTVLFQFYRITTWYTPGDGPHLGRWVEYMITSPFQIVFVALSFHVREVALLVCLFVMQGSMVLTGYTIEREIQHGLIIMGAPFLGAPFLIFSTSLVVHSVIWGVIYFQMLAERNLLKDCTAGVTAQNMTTALDMIFWSQFLLFTGFIVPLCLLLHNARQRKLTSDDWTLNASIHSILSVFTKSLLTIFFIYYASILTNISK